MNSDFFEKLVTEKVIPNLVTPSAIAMDNGHYHGKKVRKSLTKERYDGIFATSPREGAMKKFTFFLVD
jgi:hypothetical protein